MAEVLLDYAWLVALLELKGQVLFSNLCNLVVTAHSQLQQDQQDVQIWQWTASGTYTVSSAFTALFM